MRIVCIMMMSTNMTIMTKRQLKQGEAEKGEGRIKKKKKKEKKKKMDI